MSLTTVASGTRKGIRISIYTIIVLIIGRMLLGVAFNVYRQVFPAPPPPPTLAYGKLPKVAFPAGEKDLPQFTYNIQTPDGGLPKFATQTRVYFMPKPNVNLLSFDDATSKATQLGFASEPTKISETVLRFTNPKSPSTLEINIVSGIFSISYDLASDPSAISKLPPTSDSAISQVKSYLSSNGLLSADLSEGNAQTDFLNILNDKLVSALSLSEAKLTKVNLFRKDYNKLPIVTPDPASANVWFLVSATKNIIAGEYHYFPVDETQFATYPIKTSQQALDDLKNGAGFIANLGNNTTGNVTIRKVYLAYFDSGNSSDQFLEPVCVFAGDGDFVAYVPMITKNYYGE